MLTEKILTAAKTLIHQSAFSEAETLLTTALTKSKNNSSILQLLGVIKRKEGNLTSSIKYLYNSFELDNKNFYTLSLLADNYILDAQIKVAKLFLNESRQHASTKNEKNIVANLESKILAIEECNLFNMIELEVETLPRSGTGYIIRNLINNSDFGYSTVFQNELSMHFLRNNAIRYKDVFYEWPLKKRYILKSHFFKTRNVNHHNFENCQKLYLISLLYDSFYSWGHLIHCENNQTGLDKYVRYILFEESKEWGIIFNHFRSLKDWMYEILNSNYICYENIKTSKLIDEISNFYCKKNVFTNFTPDTRRIYYTKKLDSRMSLQCYYHINDYFGDILKKTYPQHLI